MYDLPRGVTTATSVTRPLMLVGPRNCHVRSLNGDACLHGLVLVEPLEAHLRVGGRRRRLGRRLALERHAGQGNARQAPSAHRRRRVRITDDMGILRIEGAPLYHGRARSLVRPRVARPACLERVLAARDAVAGDARRAVGVVVVAQFLALPDVARGPDPDRVADDLAVAVRLAGVVDVLGDVAAHLGVAHPPAVDREAPDVAAPQLVGLAGLALPGRDLLAGVLDDAGVLGDRVQGEDAPAVQSWSGGARCADMTKSSSVLRYTGRAAR